MPDLTLHVSGGYTGSDKPFIREQIKKIKNAGLKSSVRLYPEFQGDSKEEFFSSIDIMTVPVAKHDGYGLYVLESNAYGVAVAEPATGAFPEIIEMTGGGITYNPDTVEQLADSLEGILRNSELRNELAARGREKVMKELTTEKMSEGLSRIYNSTTQN
jgi:glycosyltransferase involved in cell wall biosynthesis